MDLEVRKPVNCNVFAQWLVHYQTDELPEDDRAALQEHLDGCSGCHRRLQIEDRFLEVLRDRMPRVAAPPGLETRVRAALAEADARHTGGSWLMRPWFAAVAASALLALLLFPGTGGPGAGVGPTMLAVSGQLVTVVDHDCARAGRTLEEQRKCRMPHHLNALLARDGKYWNLSLDREINKMLMLDPEMRGHRLMVDGDLYSAIRTLRIREYRDLDQDDQL
jgi:anti-sigma factor (TIGR02949 family)